MIARIYRYRIPLTAIMVVVLVLILSTVAYGYSAGYLNNVFAVGNPASENILNVGNLPPTILPSAGSSLILLLLPIEIAMVAIFILLMRARNPEGNNTVKAWLLIGITAIFMIVTFLIIYNMLDVFRGG